MFSWFWNHARLMFSKSIVIPKIFLVLISVCNLIMQFLLLISEELFYTVCFILHPKHQDSVLRPYHRALLRRNRGKDYTLWQNENLIKMENKLLPSLIKFCGTFCIFPVVLFKSRDILCHFPKVNFNANQYSGSEMYSMSVYAATLRCGWKKTSTDRNKYL